MTHLQAFLLAILQGLTEFLPISSSGHLVLAQKLLGLPQHDLAFDMIIHLGTLGSVFTIYRKTIKSLILDWIRALKEKKMNTGVWVLIYVIAATIPTGVIGLLFKDYFEAMFDDIRGAAWGFIITGVLLLVAEYISRKVKPSEDMWVWVPKMNWMKAALIGVAQAIAIIPAISRSGTTISAGLLLGMERTGATMFSFLIAIPAILGAAILELRHVDWNSAAQASIMVNGFITSYIFGLIGLAGLIVVVRKQSLKYFSLYLFILGGLVYFNF